MSDLTQLQQDELTMILQRINSAGLELRDLVTDKLYQGRLSDAVDHIHAAVTLISEFLRLHKT